MKKTMLVLALSVMSTAGFSQAAPQKPKPPFRFEIGLSQEAYLLIREGLGKLPAEKSMELIANLDEAYYRAAQAYNQPTIAPSDSTRVKPQSVEKPKDKAKK